MATHILKCRADYFDAVAKGEKTFEVRINDRGYQKGDLLAMRRIAKSDRDAHKPCMTPDCPQKCGTWLRRRITYVYAGDPTLRDNGGMVPGHVVLGLGAPD